LELWLAQADALVEQEISSRSGVAERGIFGFDDANAAPSTCPQRVAALMLPVAPTEVSNPRVESCARRGTTKTVVGMWTRWEPSALPDASQRDEVA